MADILLATLNARYRHTAMGLRCLLANLAELRPRAALREFECTDAPEELAEIILQQDPRIVALGVYLWNVEPCTRLVRLLKRIRPTLIVVLGGPEVSFETDEQAIVQAADYVICGEGERSFYSLCRALLDGQRPVDKIRRADPPDLATLAMPYDEYTAQDLAQRLLYVEQSRGCPYRCAFCLSSLDRTVRRFPLDHFLQAMQQLLDRGARQFKFVDRTFNLHLPEALAVLDFFWQRLLPGLFLHLEMVPDRLPQPLRERLQRFPPGTVQLEMGIQSFNPSVQARIRRRQNRDKSLDNMRWLLQQTGVHLHADLIVGLPGETLDSFAAGFDQLARLNPHEIQVGILKRLRGAPIREESQTFGMVYNPDPPYDLLCNDLLDFATLRRLKRLARYWDLFGNSGRFPHVRQLIVQQSEPFYVLLALCDWLFAAIGRTHEIALRHQFDWLYRGLTDGLGWDRGMVLTALESDFQGGALRELPDCLRTGQAGRAPTPRRHTTSLPARQARSHPSTDNPTPDTRPTPQTGNDETQE
ncbi:MAG: B12-binding domain-containing radical SAM protein [Magnetococcus sp. DMHC-8]